MAIITTIEIAASPEVVRETVGDFTLCNTLLTPFPADTMKGIKLKF